jgi:hypothetical protein
MRAILKSSTNAWLLGGFSILKGGNSDVAHQDSRSHAALPDQECANQAGESRDRSTETASRAPQPAAPRRTPRKSLIVVLPENHVLSPDVVSERLAAQGEESETDVILACAGQPNGIGALQRRVRDLQVLLAPAGTSGEDLRQLAMEQAPGDIVTLVSGVPAQW